MKNLFEREVLAHPYVVAAAGAAVVIALGSVVYWWQGSRTPQAPTLAQSTASTTVTGTGTVEPAENGTLAFQSGGRVVRIPRVGQAVAQGQVLASLDVGTLSAGLEQAQANLSSAQAKLSALEAGARAVDLAPKQTAVSVAEQSLTNDYSSALQTLAGGYSATYQAVHSDTDSLISNPDAPSASLAFETKSSQAQNNSLTARLTADTELANWQNEISALGITPAQSAVDSALSKALAHLSAARDLGNDLSAALAVAIPTDTFPQTSITSANTAVGAMSTVVAAQVTALQTIQQKIATDKLGVEQAQNALALAQAPATAQDLEAAQAAVQAAQASVDADRAQLANSLIISPFAGTVSSVQVKVGDIVSPGATAVSVTPNAALQVSAYFSEIDAAGLAPGMSADITLDAYGQSRHFPATVVAVDRSPTMLGATNGQAGTPGYKVTLQFSQNDPAIAVGMGANVTITH